MEHLPQSALEQALRYTAFRQMADQEAEAQLTEEHTQELAMQAYIRQNVQRMRRWDRTLTLSEAEQARLEALPAPIMLVVLAETWCGDVSQILPVVNKLAESVEQLSLHILLRDQHLEVMDAFLTNGGRAIPKVLLVDPSDLRVLGTWGPRPEAAQALMREVKAVEVTLPEEERAAYHKKGVESIHAWYARDKGRAIIAELLEALHAVSAQYA